MMYHNAICRIPGKDAFKGITEAGLGEPSIDKLLEQHKSYMDAISALGVKIEVLPALDGYPDAYFVEDTAIITPELALITNPGAPSRRGETQSIADAIKKYKNVAFIKNSNATIDGGDVLLIDKTFFVGLSKRTNTAGLEALSATFSVFGYGVVPVEVADGLHLKSSVTQIGDKAVIITQELSEHRAFRDYKKVLVTKDEAYAANTLFINGTLFMTSSFPAVIKRCEEMGCKVKPLHTSEVQKMDGALTCMSLRF